MNLSKTKSITLIDLFFGYPFKKNVQTADNVVPIPYVKKEDIIYNEYTMDYVQWKNIITRYLELVSKTLSEGNTFKMPYRMGMLETRRFKTKRFLDRVASAKEGKQIFIRKNNSENYMFYVDWLRKHSEAAFPYKWYWRFVPNRKFLKNLYEQVDRDYTFINKFKIGK